MSFTTQFQNDYATVTATASSTAWNTANDLLLAYNSGTLSQKALPIGSAASMCAITSATSNTTATAITPYGITKVTGTSSFAWTLADPPVGFTGSLYKTLFYTTSTSTGSTVTGASATFYSTTSGTASTITFSAGGAYVELQSLSTSSWAVVGRSAAGVAV